MRGSLGLFSLLDLLQLLGSNQSRGCLVVFHPVRGEGRIYVSGGRITHAAFDGRQDREALGLLLRDERGNFEFLPGRAPQAETITASLDNLLLDVIRGLAPAERPEDREIPPPDELDVPSVTDLERVSHLTLSSEEFNVIERIDGQRSVVALAQATGLDLEGVQRVLMRLASLRVLEVRKRAPRVARLVVRLSRDLSDLSAVLDDVIVRAWAKQFGGPIRRARLRQPSGRELVLDVRGAPNLGPYLLFSNTGLLRHELTAEESVLIKPEA